MSNIFHNVFFLYTGNILHALRSNQDVENANIFQMSWDFCFGVSCFVVSAALHIEALSVVFRAWHSGRQFQNVEAQPELFKDYTHFNISINFLLYLELGEVKGTLSVFKNSIVELEPSTMSLTLYLLQDL